MPKKKKEKVEINWKTAYDLWQERKNIKKLETKTPIDELIGGGIREGEVVEFYGEFGCHSEDTNVLTPHGIVSWKDIKIGDKVLGAKINGKELEICETKVLEIFTYPYNGHLFHLHSQRYDLFITPNHRILLKNRLNGEYAYYQAGFLRRDGCLPMPFKWNGLNQDYFDIRPYINIPSPQRNEKSHPKEALEPLPTDDFLKLLGWYISEGCPFKTKRGTYIQIKNERYREEIKELLERLELDFSIYEKSRFVIFHRDLAEYCKRCGVDAYTKTIPDEILALSTKHLWNLFETMMKGDGHKNGWIYYTASKKLRDKFLILLLKLGLYGSFIRLPPKSSTYRFKTILGKAPIYQINISYKPSGIFNINRNATIEPYKGTVWCFQTETGNFFTERNGKIALSGNSGKTQTALTLTVRVAGELGEDVVFIDCESTFAPERIIEIAKARGLDPEKTLRKIHLIQPVSVDEQMEAIDQIPKSIKPKLLIVDGVTTLLRVEYIGRENLAERQGLLRQFLKKLLTYVRKNKIYGVITNQVYGNPEGSPFLPLELRELAVGGHSLYHAIDNRIFIRKAQHGTRIARLVDSSCYPPAERPFVITEKGIESKQAEGE